MMTFDHKTVLLRETVEALELSPGDLAVDCTAGGGGHTALLLEAVGASGRVVAIDRDPEAIKFLSERFVNHIASNQLELVHAPFSDLASIIRTHCGEAKPNGICADLGVSSPQLDSPERGFSFMRDGPLDMRMDQSSSEQSASDIVNHASYEELVSIFRDFGEEPKSHFAAKAIVAEREKAPIMTTGHLAQLIEEAIHYKKPSRSHKATRIFQALRIAANEELAQLNDLVGTAHELLAKKGRLAIISFHSLEDRIVKKAFRDLSDPNAKLRRQMRDLPLREADLRDSSARIIKPFPVLPSKEEINGNERARSAKLRVIEHI